MMGVFPNHSPPHIFETCLEVQEIWNNLSFQWSKASLTGQNFLAICVQGSLPPTFHPSSRINDEQHSPCVLFGCSGHKLSSLDLQKKKIILPTEQFQVLVKNILAFFLYRDIFVHVFISLDFKVLLEWYMNSLGLLLVPFSGTL